MHFVCVRRYRRVYTYRRRPPRKTGFPRMFTFDDEKSELSYYVCGPNA
jgi:hypothetical protein